MHMKQSAIASNKPVNWLWLVFWAAILAYLPVLLTERAFFGIPLTNTQLLNLGQTQINLMLISMLGALSLNYLTGCAGLISIGHAAFFATGAMAAAIFDNQLGLPFPLVLLAAALAGAFAGTLAGLPSLRVRGLYLAVATLAAQFFADWMFLRIKWFTLDTPSGSVSVSNLQVFGMPIESDVSKYLFCLTLLCVVALLAKNLVRGAIGREWMAIRDMDVAAAVIGIRPMYAKLSAFAVSSFIIGMAGALWAFIYMGSWEPSAFSVNESFRLLFMVIIGGMGSIMGGFLGAAFIVVLPIFLNQFLPVLAAWFGIAISTAVVSHTELMIFGALIVWFLIVEPHGLARLWAIGKQKMRVWPFPY